MSGAATSPKRGERAMFCVHLSNGGNWPRMRGAHVLRVLPDQMLTPGELAHDWLFLCGSCREVRRRDPVATIDGFRWTLQVDLSAHQLERYGAVL